MLRSVPLDRLEELGAADLGLTEAEARRRLRSFGGNAILLADSGGLWRLVRATLGDPMVWFLLGTSALFAWVGERVDALIMLAALVPFVAMDAYLHRRTLASTQGLASRLASEANVKRDGCVTTIAAVALVPGDLVLVRTGEGFPADGVVVAGERLQVDESTLTGEAYPVRKLPLDGLPRENGEARVDARHWGFAGTRVLAGEAWLRVVFTGGETLYGEIVRSATQGATVRTPLQVAVANLVTVLVVSASLMCLVLAWVRLQQGHGMLDALLSAVTLAVAALPEEFPLVLTFFLGVGVYRLAKRQALVRRAVVVENIGRVTCICADKTGTLTLGRLQLTHRYPADGVDDAHLLFWAAAASRRESGDPMDLAILDAHGAAVVGKPVTVFPFTEDRKRETAILERDGSLACAVKGAPEVVLDMCGLDAAARADWLARTEALAASGHKVIACAWQQIETAAWLGGEPDRGLRFAGLLAFEDPVRDGVAAALRQCLEAHVRVVMVTGDHPATARAVAREIGLGGEVPCVVEGDEMAHRLVAGDTAFLQDVSVIARAVPAQKLALVRALQGRGEIVAVTGDGVNDVPALQAADIGIAMGERGTRSARDVAAIVLLDDNLRSIVHAIGEGRQLFANMQASFMYLLMIHIPLVLTAALIPLAGYPVLYLPVHIVWLEMLIHPTALFVFQHNPPRARLAPAVHKPEVRFFSVRQWLLIAGVGGAVTALISLSYLRSLGAGFDVEHARAMALVALTTASAGITLNLSRLRTPAAWIMIGATLALSILLVQTPVLSSSLHLRPLHLDDWMLALAGGAVASLLAALPAGPRSRSASGDGALE